ncbi:hypothetical protein ACFUCH_35470 [Streptomyces olivaceus]|uniref:hypothetical protein n=1 Tax=Streptomyces olivaceus TaxID=47716 RepID=UPI0036425649
MFYDPEFAPPQMIIRYVIGMQEREALVLTKGHSLEDHVERVESLTESPISAATYATWPLAQGGAVAIRIDSIIAFEASEGYGAPKPPHE